MVAMIDLRVSLSYVCSRYIVPCIAWIHQLPTKNGNAKLTQQHSTTSSSDVAIYEHRTLIHFTRKLVRV